jgi:hypothetical protein
MEIDNIDLMFNCFDSKEQYKKAKGRKESKNILLELKSWMKIQEELLNLFYKKFKKSRLLKLIVAAYEMKRVYRSYCPPLRPLQIREYLLKPWSRKPIVRELKRRKSVSGSNFSLAPLHETIRRINLSFARKKKEHLLSFLKDFLRYHRDLGNGRLLKQAMGAINLVKDEKILLLSKKNQLLYEFLLPEERGKEEKTIISHVIIKADIRGSIRHPISALTFLIRSLKFSATMMHLRYLSKEMRLSCLSSKTKTQRRAGIVWPGRAGWRSRCFILFGNIMLKIKSMICPFSNWESASVTCRTLRRFCSMGIPGS